MYDEITTNENWTLWSLVSANSEHRGDDEAFVFDTGALSYRDIELDASRVARAFLQEGIGVGDRVAIWMTGRHYWPALFFGLTSIGAVLVPLNTRLKASEVQSILRSARPSAIVFHDESASDKDSPSAIIEAVADEVQDPESTLRLVVRTSDSGSAGRPFAEFLNAGQEVSNAALDESRSAVGPDSVALVQFTSGTTAAPKGALLFQSAMVRGAAFCAQALEMSPSDKFFSASPFYHVGGSLHVMLMPFVAGSCVVVQPMFDPIEAFRLMSSHGCTATIGHQPHWVEYLNHATPEVLPESLRKAFIFAGPAINRRVTQELGLDLVSPYGMTETHLAGTTCHLSDSEEVRLETLGRPYPGVELRIYDASTDRSLAPGETGEVCFRGWCIMRGYLDDPVRTQEVIDSEGWFHTGDLGVVDEHGRLRLRGRLKEMIRVGGENVAAAEIEDHLMSHPEVAQAVVVGKPNERLGEICVAFVELNQGATTTTDELVGWCQETLAKFKVPREVHVVADWPMSGTGKISRKELANAVMS